MLSWTVSKMLDLYGVESKFHNVSLSMKAEEHIDPAHNGMDVWHLRRR
jgi:hypothetical protein